MKEKVFNGNRLKEVRYFKSMSITELSDKLGLSKQMVSKYENGKSAPTAENFFKIVRELGFPSNFYFGEDQQEKSSETFFRSRFTATQKQKSPAETLKNVALLYRDFLEDYIEFPHGDFSEMFKEEIANLYEQKKIDEIANRLREYWNLGVQPIPNMINLLEKKGFVVCDIPQTLSKIDAFGGKERINNRDYYIIFLEKEETDFFRKQFSAAHELGHRIIHSEVLNPQDLDPFEYRMMEKEADEFASAFLLPFTSFSQDFNRSVDLKYVIGLKNKWFASMASMLYRAKALHLITENDYIKFQKQISYYKYRKNEPAFREIDIKRPQTLKQATEMLINEGVIKKNEIPLLIENKYTKAYPNSLIEEIAGLPIGYFASDVEESIFILKGESYVPAKRNQQSASSTVKNSRN